MTYLKSYENISTIAPTTNIITEPCPIAPELLCDLPGDLFPILVHVLIHHHLNDIRHLPNNLPVLLSSQPPTPILILLPNHVSDFLREFPGEISMEKS